VGHPAGFVGEGSMWHKTFSCIDLLNFKKVGVGTGGEVRRIPLKLYISVSYMTVRAARRYQKSRNYFNMCQLRLCDRILGSPRRKLHKMETTCHKVEVCEDSC
jgi:hypothetical protein